MKYATYAGNQLIGNSGEHSYIGRIKVGGKAGGRDGEGGGQPGILGASFTMRNGRLVSILKIQIQIQTMYSLPTLVTSYSTDDDFSPAAGLC